VRVARAHRKDAGIICAPQKEICETVFVKVSGCNTGVLTTLAKTNICRYISEGAVSQVTKQRWRIFFAIEDE
jgi:uncharacterized protein (UPF0261 family)